MGKITLGRVTKLAPGLPMGERHGDNHLARFLKFLNPFKRLDNRAAQFVMAKESPTIELASGTR